MESAADDRYELIAGCRCRYWTRQVYYCLRGICVEKADGARDGVDEAV